jgi:putative (di)nucleoside polyphosphate hydrolase
MSSQSFRAGVVIVIRHPDLRQVMAFERADSPGDFQLPQGGLDVGEEPIEGAWRELGEETGLGADDVVARAEFPEWTVSEWPEEVRLARGKLPTKRGQVHRWFLFDAVSTEVSPQPDGSEFVSWKWVEPSWLIQHVPAWRRPAYEKVLSSL